MADLATALTDADARPRTGPVVQAIAVALSLAPVVGVAIWSLLWVL